METKPQEAREQEVKLVKCRKCGLYATVDTALLLDNGWAEWYRGDLQCPMDTPAAVCSHQDGASPHDWTLNS